MTASMPRPTKDDLRLRKIQLQNCGDWNGAAAMDAYARDDLDTYCRLIGQADRLWAAAAAIRVQP